MTTKLTRIDADNNAYTFSFDPGLLDEIKANFESHLACLKRRQFLELFRGGRVIQKPFSVKASEQPLYYICSFKQNPLLWLSTNHKESFDVFQRFFEALDLKAFQSILDCQDKLVMYCGFFVMGYAAPRPMWHTDYLGNANAYTLITPLAELHPQHGHLYYWRRKQKDKLGIYHYKPGEAIAVGQGFFHSTEPYTYCGAPRILVSLTFGGDKLKYWDQLKRAVGGQSNYYRLPCGHTIGQCGCLHDKRNA